MLFNIVMRDPRAFTDFDTKQLQNINAEVRAQINERYLRISMYRFYNGVLDVTKHLGIENVVNSIPS